LIDLVTQLGGSFEMLEVIGKFIIGVYANKLFYYYALNNMHKQDDFGFRKPLQKPNNWNSPMNQNLNASIDTPQNPDKGNNELEEKKYNASLDTLEKKKTRHSTFYKKNSGKP